MRIVILTALWQRPMLSHIFLAYYQAMKRRFEGRLDLYLLAVGSEGEISQNLAATYEWAYIEAPNQPLSAKWSAGSQSLRALKPDATIILGSDDFISDALLDRYLVALDQGHQVLGVLDAYFFECGTERLFHWKGYPPNWRHNETIGMGRCISRQVMERLDYDPWGDCRINSGLDLAMSKRLKILAIEPYGQRQSDLGAVAVDIKCGQNITSLSAQLGKESRYYTLIANAALWFAQQLPALDYARIKTCAEPNPTEFTF